MKIILNFFIIGIFSMLPFMVCAQGDHYESGGKLIAVIACVLVILIGVFLFLFYLERHIKKLEDETNESSI